MVNSIPRCDTARDKMMLSANANCVSDGPVAAPPTSPIFLPNNAACIDRKPAARRRAASCARQPEINDSLPLRSLDAWELPVSSRAQKSGDESTGTDGAMKSSQGFIGLVLSPISNRRCIASSIDDSRFVVARSTESLLELALTAADPTIAPTFLSRDVSAPGTRPKACWASKVTVSTKCGAPRCA